MRRSLIGSGTPAWSLLLLLAAAVACAACGLDRSGLESQSGSFGGSGGGAGGAGGIAGASGGSGGSSADAAADGVGGTGGLDGGAGAGGGQSGGDAAVEVKPISPIGCSDGTREGFTNQGGYPLIAACAGGWSIPGLLSTAARAPLCGRQSGNSSTNPAGSGCSVTDLCAEGWHVCKTANEVLQTAGDCTDATGPASAGHAFFVTLQRALGPTCPAANDVGSNRLHGCGNFGAAEDQSCTPFPFMLRDMDCQANAPWSCPIVNAGTIMHGEYENVTKAGSALGGALCCHD